MVSELKTLSFSLADHRLWTGAWLVWHQSQLHYCVGSLWIQNWKLYITDLSTALEELFVSKDCEHTIIEPSSEAWEVFWLALKQLKVDSWHKAYETTRMVDGLGWHVKIEHDNWQAKSGGNLFPDNFYDFCKVVSELINSSEFQDMCHGGMFPD